MILERHALVDSNWNDLCPKAEWQAAQDKKKGQRGGGLVVSKEGLLRHRIQPYCNLGGQQIGWSCDRCRAWTRTPQALERWARIPCNAQKCVKWGLQARQQCWLVQGHPIMKAGSVLWCLRCGKYTESSLKGLKMRCEGRPANPSRHNKLKQGRHPITGKYLGEPSRAMGEAWWQVIARGTNLARNERERGGLVIELGVLPEEWARKVPDEPPELCMDGLSEQGAGGGLAGPKSVCRPRCLPGCLQPSDSRRSTHAAELGGIGEPRPFRVLDMGEPAASTLVGGLSQGGGPLRGSQLSVTVEGDPGGLVGRHRRGGGRAPPIARGEVLSALGAQGSPVGRRPYQGAQEEDGGEAEAEGEVEEAKEWLPPRASCAALARGLRPAGGPASTRCCELQAPA